MKLINTEVRIETTRLCNASCSICPRENIKKLYRTKSGTPPVMPLPQFKGLVDQAKDLGATFISLFGYGEPLMDSTITKKIKYCTQRGLETFITTNGSLLTKDVVVLLLDAGLSYIRFSVHGLNKKDYEDVHKRLNFETTFRNIYDFIIENNKKRKGMILKQRTYPLYEIHPKITTSVSVIPMHDESIEAIVNMWEPLVDWLEIWKPHGWAGQYKFRDKTVARKSTCGRPNKGPIQINYDGRVMICCFDSSAKMIVGDTNVNTIEEILKSDKYNRIREIHNNGLIDQSDLPCKDCDQLNIGDDPLLYSNRVKKPLEGRTSSTKFILT